MADMNGTLYCLEGVAGTWWPVHDPRRAALLFGAASVLREEANLLIEPADQIPYDQAIALARAAMTERAFAEGFAKGRELKLDEAVRLALAEPESERLREDTASPLSRGR